MSLYGPLFDGTRIEAAAKDTLVLWLPSYLAEVERQVEIAPGTLPQPRSWLSVPSAEILKWPEDQLPAVALLCAGLAGEPEKEGDGTVSAGWALGVGIFVSANTRENTDRLAKLYAAAIRGVVLQKPSLRGVALATDWLDESYDDLPVEQTRSMAAARLVFRVEVPEVMNATLGPAEPSPPVDGSWPKEITDVDVDVQPEGA